MRFFDPRSVLGRAAFYRCYRTLVISSEYHSKLRALLELRPGSRVLDLGCGTGDLLESLPGDIDYVGIDASERYIEAARRRYKDHHQFQVRRIGAGEVTPAEGFDAVIACGLLHHLDDSDADELADTAYRALRPGGTVTTIDPVLLAEAPLLAKILIRWDRGAHVRTAHQYERVFARVFPDVEVIVRDDLLRVPYVHAIVRARRPD